VRTQVRLVGSATTASSNNSTWSNA
jgi:hypothetical protein